MHSVRAALLDDAPTIVSSVLARWRRIVEVEPWWTTEHVDADHLLGLVRQTAEAALKDEVDEEVAARFIATAFAHGRDRRTDGHRDTVVHHEYLLLRRALRDDLQERFGTGRDTHEACSRLDGALNHAEIASLHGYHRQELPEESAREAPKRLTREWLRLRRSWPAAG